MPTRATMPIRSPAAHEHAPHAPAIRAGRLGWLAGAGIGVVVLVLGPIVHPLDANYLIPTHWRLALLATGAASMAGAFVLGRRWRDALRWAVALAAGLLSAFLIRLVMDIAHDPTDHNLWPIELVLDFVLTLAWSVPGAAIGWGARRMADAFDAP